jgi:hypothetical protein
MSPQIFKLGTMRKGADGFVSENLWKMHDKNSYFDRGHDMVIAMTQGPGKEKDSDEKKKLQMRG